MNFSRILNFIFILFYVGLCLPSVGQSESNSNTNHQNQSTAVEVNASKNNGVTQHIQEDVVSHTLKPRFEANWRYSNDRSILMGEFWLPLMQCEEESVFFCDIRLMGDDNENKEFNVGLGYREVLHDTFLGDGVAGAMLWFDRRFTDRDFQFNQVTVGGEWLGEQYDLRMNGYFPIDKKKSYEQANPNGTGEGFVGNQILVNTNQVVVEEVLPGIDFEVGSQLNFMNGVTDSTRFFVGGYHFDGEIAEDITGVRTRIVSDITSDVQVGARFQHDDVRGSQTYVESTIRFPFGHKKKYKREGIWSRLDEAPERDIDVVSNETVTVNGTNESLLNAMSGLEQNVIHVDNTAVGGGNGTIENPYNTLAAAEGAATTNDMIYVHKGDGATTGQNAGIVLNDSGQMLVGSGTDLLYSSDRFKTSNGNSITGALVPATTAPMITNGAGDGVDVTADNIFISGVTIDGATSDGIEVDGADNVIIDNVTSDNNTAAGIFVQANAISLDAVTITNSSMDNNSRGVFVFAGAGGDIDFVNISGNRSNNSTSEGIRVEVNGAGSTIATTHFTNNTAESSMTGIFAYALSNGNIGTVNFRNNSSNNNTIYGLFARAQSDGDIATVNMTNNSTSNNTNSGVFVLAGDVGSTVTTANIISNTIENNNQGVSVIAQTDGYVGTANISNNVVSDNTSFGLYVNTLSGGDIDVANVRSNTVTNNTFGIRVEADGAGSTITTSNLISNNSNSNTNGLYAFAESNGNLGIVNVTGNTAQNNSVDGLGILIRTDGDIAQVSFEGNTSTGNTGDGTSIVDDSIAGNLVVDFGGGAFGSAGNNRIFANTSEELKVDLDGGNLVAENNWWGSTSGLVGGETDLRDASTVDASPFLTSDPE